MNNKERILAYLNAKVLTAKDLQNISGGSAQRATLQLSGHGSGGYPGNLDGEADQIWD